MAKRAIDLSDDVAREVNPDPECDSSKKPKCQELSNGHEQVISLSERPLLLSKDCDIVPLPVLLPVLLEIPKESSLEISWFSCQVSSFVNDNDVTGQISGLV